MVATMPTDTRTDAEIIGEALRASSSSTTTITAPNVHELYRVLTNGLICAGSDSNRPPLYGVHFEITTTPERTDGTGDVRRAVCVSTDSYKLMHQDLEAWEITGPDRVFFLDRDDLAPVLALCKAIKPSQRAQSGPVAITAGKVGALGLTTPTTASPRHLIEFRGAIVVDMRDAGQDCSFPNWRQLVPDGAPHWPTEQVAVNPMFIAALCKYSTRDGGDPAMRFAAHENAGAPGPCALKPIRITWSNDPGDNFALLMPVRTS